MPLIADKKKKLIELFIEKGFDKFGDNPLSSFNMKSVTYNPGGQVLIGALIYEKIRELNLEPAGIGGLTTGADPVSIATAFTSRLRNSPIEAFVI